MGTMQHHVVVVTSWNKELILDAHKEAVRLRCAVSDVVEGVINGYQSFFMIAPDGSKEGWDDSQIGDAQRAAFLKWVGRQAYEDGSNSLTVLHATFGELGSAILD